MRGARRGWHNPVINARHVIRLLILLIGAEMIQRRWQTVGLAGLAWCGLGLFIFIDSLDAVTLIPVHDFGWLLIVEGSLTLLAGLGGTGAARSLRLVKGGGVLLVGLMMIESPFRSDVALALLIGLAFAADGILRIASAAVIRFPGWRRTQAAGVVMLLLAIATLQPWPTWYVGTIGCNVGVLLILSGVTVMLLANRLRVLPPDAPLSPTLGGGDFDWTADLPHAEDAGGEALIVRVWTPTGHVRTRQRRPIIDRYIAAVDVNGVLSTGHAALEMPPDLYISHYPATEVDRSADDFGRMLRATPDNNVAGRFLPSYRWEAEWWCEANMQVRFATFNARRLRAFWAAYRADATYNLTHRNCSSVVAHALDAALEGVLAAQASPFRGVLRAVTNPELWVASLLRSRAEAMAWTPGLVLDYARALSAVLDPPPLTWTGRVRRILDRRRHAARRAAPAAAAPPGSNPPGAAPPGSDPPGSDPPSSDPASDEHGA